jgi:hypothetical protein
MGSIVTVQPSISFSPNATLKLRFSDAGMPRGLTRAGVGLRRATNQTWTDIGGSDATLENLVQGTITTTGTYGAGRMRPLQACSAPEDRAFDFWVGSWTVTAGAAQQTVATSDITLESGGCAVFEHYVPLGNAPVGRSVTFRSADGQWHQTYMDDSGARLLISGSSPAPGVMSLDTTPGASTFERWLWTRNADGSVRQIARVTANGGATFAAPSWDGLYTRRQ